MKKLSLVCIVIKTVESQEGNKQSIRTHQQDKLVKNCLFFSNLLMFDYEFVLIAPPE